MKVAILGHFGMGANLLNGQTVKTKIVTEELQKQLGHDQVMIIDTHGGWKTLLKAPFQVYSALKSARNTVIFPAHNGVRVYGMLLPIFRCFFKGRRLHYVVIGGWLPQFLGNKKMLSKALKRFDGIYVETNTMKNALEAQGFENVFVMPNCKDLKALTHQQLVYATEPPYRLCTFSRVSKEKGIEDAVNAVRAVNKELGYTAYMLDIYGQVDAAQTEWFEKLKADFPDFIKYCGIVPFDKSTEILKNYFALLFPTYYEGEGFAGTLIDAFAAGVPVIASDWKYNTEIINENAGCVYPARNHIVFVGILKAVATNPSMILNKKPLCLKESEKYRIDKAVRILAEQIESDQNGHINI